MLKGAVLYGPPAGSKSSVTAELTALDPRFVFKTGTWLGAEDDFGRTCAEIPMRREVAEGVRDGGHAKVPGSARRLASDPLAVL